MPWGVQEELIAQVVEEVSVLVAGMTRDKPLTLPRPYEKKTQPREGLHNGPDGAISANGLGGMLALARQHTANPDTLIPESVFDVEAFDE